MTTTAQAPTLTDAIAYINSTDERGLDSIVEAIRARQRSLHAERAAAVTVGMTATLAGLKPKYLNGLSGTVTSIDRNRATVELDESSTNTLRWTRQRRYDIAHSQQRYSIPGIPLACITSN